MTLNWGFLDADEVRQQNAKAMEEISKGADPGDYGRLATQLKGQLHRLFRKPFNPDLLPPWPHRESRVARTGISLALKKHVAQSALREIIERRPCRYHPWLRTKESRPLVLAAWQGELKRTKPDSTATNRTANHLLRQMFELWCGPAIVQTIVHRAKTQHAGKSRQRAVAELFGDRVVPVRALRRSKAAGRYVEPGAEYQVLAWVFLKEAYNSARNPPPLRQMVADSAGTPAKHLPIFEAIGDTPAAECARDCWLILETLASFRADSSVGNRYQRVSIPTIQRRLYGHKGGDRHSRLVRLTDGLAAVGVVGMAQTKKGRRVWLKTDGPKRKEKPSDGKNPLCNK